MPKAPRDGNSIDHLVGLPGPWAWTAIALVSLIVVALAVFRLYGALAPVLLGFALAYACDPLVSGLERRGWSRAWAVSLLLAGTALALALAVMLVIPRLSADFTEFVEHFPDYSSWAVDRGIDAAHALGLQPPEKEAILQGLLTRFQTWARGVLSGELGAVNRLVAGAGNVLTVVLGLLLVPVFFFFQLRDLPAMRRGLREWVPPRHRPMVHGVLGVLHRAFAGYFVGQMFVALILGVALATGLSLLGVRYGLAIGLLSGLLNVVPYAGQFIGLLLALMMASLDFDGWGRVLAVPVLYGALNFIESSFITPHVVGEKVGLSPVQTMIAILVGASLAGFLGLIIAIPLAGAAKVFILDLRLLYMDSRLYRGPAGKRTGKR